MLCQTEACCGAAAELPAAARGPCSAQQAALVPDLPLLPSVVLCFQGLFKEARVGLVWVYHPEKKQDWLTEAWSIWCQIQIRCKWGYTVCK